MPIFLEKNGLYSWFPTIKVPVGGKNGLVIKLPKPVNKSEFSIKNCRCSGKFTSNLVRLTTCLSASTFEKSGFIVKSKFKPEVTPILASNPIPDL